MGDDKSSTGTPVLLFWNVLFGISRISNCIANSLARCAMADISFKTSCETKAAVHMPYFVVLDFQVWIPMDFNLHSKQLGEVCEIGMDSGGVAQNENRGTGVRFHCLRFFRFNFHTASKAFRVYISWVCRLSRDVSPVEETDAE